MRFGREKVLGAPGLYRDREVGVRSLTGVRMDVCAFVGVAPRGPAYVPVIDEKWTRDCPWFDLNRPHRRTIALPVESFDEYRRLYGGFEGPGLLPYAVASFFEQGGRRAYIARIVHKYADLFGDRSGIATGTIPGIKGNALVLQARNEGAWGNRLQAQLRFSSRPVGTVLESASTHLVLRNTSEIEAGTLVRLTLTGGVRALRFVTMLVQEPQATGAMVWKALFDQPLGESLILTEIVEGDLEVNDGMGRTERHERVGFAPLHPRWLARILCDESELVMPARDFNELNLYPESAALQPPDPSPLFINGLDRGIATGTIPGIKGNALVLQARNEGIWGNRLQAHLRFFNRPVGTVFGATPAYLLLSNASEIDAGTLVRLTLPGGMQVLRFVTMLVQEPQASGAMMWKALFDKPLGESPVLTEIVEGELEVNDGMGRTERHEWVGFAPSHPRWLARILCNESELVMPARDFNEVNLYPESAALQPPSPSPLFTNGLDRYREIIPEDFFDEKWTLGDDEARDGVHALVGIADLSSVVVPDLYSPRPLDPIEPVLDPGALAGPTFERCVTVPNAGSDQENPRQDLEGLRLDPRNPDELRQIVGLQERLVEIADLTRGFITLLDIPPGLSQRQILAWKTHFDSSYAAAYCPWVTVARRDDQRDTLIRVPPSAVAAGIIAKQEIVFGIPHGPANVLAQEVVSVEDVISSPRHDELHPMGLNVYLQEADGVRLTAARTLSLDPAYRQLSVRRLVMMLRRTIEQRMQWVAFEPNHASLRADVRHHLEGLLQGLYRSGAFRGAREEEAFFVRCDEVLNPPRVLDRGQLIVEIGIAPTEPIEFIVLRLMRSGDGTLTLEE